MQKYIYYLIAGLFLWSCHEIPLIRAPFQGIENNIHQLTFDNSSGGTLALGNGTKITVPPNAFVYTDGKSVTGEVTLAYTEMQDLSSQNTSE